MCSQLRHAGYSVVALKNEYGIIGALLTKGNEIHVAFDEKVSHGTIRRHIRDSLGKMIEKYGHAVTSVRKQNEKGLRFCERLGFVKTGEKNGAIQMRCDRCNYA